MSPMPSADILSTDTGIADTLASLVRTEIEAARR